MREAGVRRILQRLDPEEIDGLLAWRRLELAAAAPDAETRARTERLEAIESRIAEVRSQRERSGLVRQLAIDGQVVMETLGAGPGPHVGRALAHLARFIQRHPESNEPEALARELQAWSEAPDDERD